MSSDSQDIILLENKYKKLRQKDWKKNKIIKLKIKKFKGLIGYVGTELINGLQTRPWLENFINKNSSLSLGNFSKELATQLTNQWEKKRKKSCLWIFIAGFERKEVRFWYINNTKSIDSKTYLYKQIGTSFQYVNDLDNNYIQPIMKKCNMTKKRIIKARLFNFRNGIIYPFAEIYIHFNEILQTLWHSNEPGFRSPRTLKDFAFIFKQRFEFIKRLYSEKYGIYRKQKSPIGGNIYVYAMNNKQELFKCNKNKFNRESIK